MGCTYVTGRVHPSADPHNIPIKIIIMKLKKSKNKHKHRSMRTKSQNCSRKSSVFREINETPARFSGAKCPVNLKEQKEKFLNHGILPKFELRESSSSESIGKKAKEKVRFNLFHEAKAILDRVKEKYGDGEKYMEAMYGPRIDYVRASEILADYFKDNSLDQEVTVYWTPELTASARMMWHGPSMKYNKPEGRKYSLVLKNSTENGFLREHGIQCLADHEIGTHFFRMLNDGFQPWFSDRKKFGLRGCRGRDFQSSEEGLAAINTVVNARAKYLWNAALVYYNACMSVELSFRDLFKHLEKYVADPEMRWKHVMRVKRLLKDQSQSGGIGCDQCYFEGAVAILRNIEKIDFQLLYSGRICIDETHRIRRLARLDCIKIPQFMKDIEKYKKTLRNIAYLNGLVPRPERRVSTHTAKLDKRRRRNLQVASEASGTGFTPTPPPYSRGYRQSSGCDSYSESLISNFGPSYRSSPMGQSSVLRNQAHDFSYLPSAGVHRDSPMEGCEAGEDEEESSPSEGCCSPYFNRRLLSRPRSDQPVLGTPDSGRQASTLSASSFGMLETRPEG